MLLGTEFYTSPPFEIIEDYTFDGYSSQDLKDFTELEKLNGTTQEKSIKRIFQLFEKHEEKTNFVTLFSNCLVTAERRNDALLILELHLEQNPQDIDLKFCLAKLLIIEGDLERVEELVGEYLIIKDHAKPKKLTPSQFLNYCTIAIFLYLESKNIESALKVYSWTLKEEFETFNKEMAFLIAGSLIQPIPQKFEELDESENSDKPEPLDTYFHHLDLNEKPYHQPFANYHDLFLDEIALQDIRSIESVDNRNEIDHDIRWLLKNEVVRLQNREGVFEPAGGKFAFILASYHLSTSCFEDLLSALRLPFTPYFDFIFKENFFEYILNPFYHLGLKDINPLLDYVKEKDHSLETREAVARVLKVIVKETPERKLQINEILETSELTYVTLPEKYEIIENKLPQLLKHFIDIPIDYFNDEDDDFVFDDSDKNMPDYQELPGGGMVSKPDSLESAVFSNYMLAFSAMQNEMEMYEMPPPETEAPLRPVFKLDKIGRNDLCPCGSGKKYKKCCLNLN